MFRVFSEKPEWHVFGTVRSSSVKSFFPSGVAQKMIAGIDVNRYDILIKIFGQTRPHVVINCVGITKHHAEANEPLPAISVNALLPHRLAGLCGMSGARLIHISTDCIFSGDKGAYTENDPSDAKDIYGKTKFLGEVYYPHTVTLRTSTIGHELKGANGLLEWFLLQPDNCKGFTHAIFSGLPTVVFAQIIRDIIISHPELSGLYHVAGQPISKYDLLRLVAEIYGISIDIIPDDNLVIDRSLNAERFRKATGYIPPGWIDLIKLMRSYK
jgi:dTDP-4-dehydrorhamnose reductase